MQQLQQTARASHGWASDSLEGSPRAAPPSAGTAPIPVVSMELVSSLEAYFPAGSPVVHLLKAPAAFPAAEADHLGGRGHFEEGSEVVGVGSCGCWVLSHLPPLKKNVGEQSIRQPGQLDLLLPKARWRTRLSEDSRPDPRGPCQLCSADWKGWVCSILCYLRGRVRDSRFCPSPMQATIALFTDGTVAVEVSLSLALIQWPFLTDISLAWAAASIFDPLSAEAGTDPSTAAATTAAESILRNSELAPWLYFNCILRDSQLFVPVADPVRPPVPSRWSSRARMGPVQNHDVSYTG